MGRHDPTVVVASDDPELLDELARHLDEVPTWRLAALATSPDELRAAVVTHRPDAVIVSDGVAAPDRASFPGRLVLVATEQEPGVLRRALALGAGFVLWPQERDDLRAVVESGLTAPAPQGTGLAAVWAPKGGSGGSVLAAHLVAAAAAVGTPGCTLVDLDVRHGDQRALLGAAEGSDPFWQAVAERDAALPEAAGAATWRHPAGFGALLAPPSPVSDDAALAALEGVLAAAPPGGLVVADVPSGLVPISVAVAARATAVVLVVTPDLLAFRRARTAAALLADAGPAGGAGSRTGLLLNRWPRGTGLAPADVEAVTGLPVWHRVPPHAGLLRTPDTGRLSRPVIRSLAPLVARLAGAAAEPAAAVGAGR